MIAGLAGLSVTGVLGLGGVLDGWPAALTGLATIAGGWGVMLLSAPWRAMRTLGPDARSELAALNEKLHAIIDGDRTIALRELIIEREDQMGELSRLVHELATGTRASRQHSRLLQRLMVDNIHQETRRATAHLRREAATDPLTGLGNRRAMEQWVLEALKSHPAGCRLAALAFDLDLFKEVNDALGHETGDRCLVFLADLLRSSIRREDCAVRLGGDEFLLLMPEMKSEQAEFVATRLASLFAQMPWAANTPRRPTLSFGIAAGVIHSSDDLANMLRQADSNLYSNKRSSRESPACDQQRGAA